MIKAGGLPPILMEPVVGCSVCEGNISPDVVAYSSYLKTLYNTNWAYSAFATNNPNNGLMGWAIIGLPLINTRITGLLTGGNDYHSRVFAHETIHDFWGLDEYFGMVDDYNSHNYIRNGNTVDINDSPVKCLMNLSGNSICGWTAGQIGWTEKVHRMKLSTVPEGLTYTISEMATESGTKSFAQSSEHSLGLGSLVSIYTPYYQTLENNNYTFHHLGTRRHSFSTGQGIE